MGIPSYENQPAGKAALLLANVVSIRGSAGVTVAIDDQEVDFQFDYLCKWENRWPQKDLFQAMGQVAV